MMKNSENGYHNLATDHSNPNRQTLGNMLHNNSDDQEEHSFRFSTTSESSATNPPPLSAATSPAAWDQSPPSFSSTPSTDLSASPLSKSPWSSHVASESYSYTGLIGSLVRQEGHVYSLAASGDLLYTGSDSKNIRVWKNQKEYSGFKSTSGLVKAIIISGDQIFTGHQDGQIRVWKVSGKDPSMYKRVGKLPTFKAIVKSSFKRSNYVEIRRHKNAIWIKHVDAISCLSLSEDKSLLYSASWDKTIKVWRISDSKCLESINAHDDAINSIVSGFDGLVFTGSADGSVKVWRREMQGKGTAKHSFSQTLLKQESAVTSLIVGADPSARVIYCGSSDGLVNFWVRDKVLSHAGVLRGHKLAVLCLVSSGNLVFSGSADMNICVWRKEGLDHICLSVLSGHTGPVKCLAVEEEKSGAYLYGGERRYMVYSGSLDKSVKIWRVSALAACAMQTPLGPPPQQQHQNVNQTAALNQGQGFHPSENTGRVTQRRNF